MTRREQPRQDCYDRMEKLLIPFYKQYHNYFRVMLTEAQLKQASVGGGPIFYPSKGHEREERHLRTVTKKMYDQMPHGHSFYRSEDTFRKHGTTDDFVIGDYPGIREPNNVQVFVWLNLQKTYLDLMWKEIRIAIESGKQADRLEELVKEMIEAFDKVSKLIEEEPFMKAALGKFSSEAKKPLEKYLEDIRFIEEFTEIEGSQTEEFCSLVKMLSEIVECDFEESIVHGMSIMLALYEHIDMHYNNRDGFKYSIYQGIYTTLHRILFGK